MKMKVAVKSAMEFSVQCLWKAYGLLNRVGNVLWTAVTAVMVWQPIPTSSSAVFNVRTMATRIGWNIFAVALLPLTLFLCSLLLLLSFNATASSLNGTVVLIAQCITSHLSKWWIHVYSRPICNSRYVCPCFQRWYLSLWNICHPVCCMESRLLSVWYILHFACTRRITISQKC